MIRGAGFDTVRLPVRWSAHADHAPPFYLDEGFAAQVDDVVDSALARDLTVVVDVHHYDEVCSAPALHADRLVGLWERIATRYADRGDRLWLELLNEPSGALEAAGWNSLLRRVLAALRAVDPRRTVVVGPVRHNSIDALDALDLPDDSSLVATVHYYSPMRFTHQGAAWIDGADQWPARTWGEEADRSAVTADLERAAAWAAVHRRPLLVGEFGTYERAGLASRVRWTTHVRSELERLGIDWCCWDLGTASASTTSTGRCGASRCAALCCPEVQRVRPAGGLSARARPGRRAASPGGGPRTGPAPPVLLTRSRARRWSARRGPGRGSA